MRPFLLKLFVFSVLLAGSAYSVFIQADGSTDPFYLRFTSPKQQHLILGTSRAAQGVRPDVLNEILQKRMYNFAFTEGRSSFGQTYLESIKRKLAIPSGDGVYIVTVSPWSLSSLLPDPNAFTQYRELDRCLGTTTILNMNPNPFYLLNNTPDGMYTLLAKNHSPLLLHDDGWLEVTVDMRDEAVGARLKNKIRGYRDKEPRYSFSDVRFDYLVKTIQHLQTRGRVFLVRLPMHPRLMKIENRYMPKFDAKIQMAIQLAEGYLDLTERNAEFRYTDGTHLHKESGILVSRIIGDWIVEETRAD